MIHGTSPGWTRESGFAGGLGTKKPFCAACCISSNHNDDGSGDGDSDGHDDDDDDDDDEDGHGDGHDRDSDGAKNRTTKEMNNGSKLTIFSNSSL